MSKDETTITAGDVQPLASLTAPVEDVTCDTCGHSTQIMSHPVDGHEQRWKCDCKVDRATDCQCEALNVIPGEPGEPGEGALNPAASAVTDEDLLEAVERRGLTHKLNLEGGAAPEGQAQA